MDVKISEIVVGSRHRKDAGDLTTLADSMREIGQLQPVGLDEDNALLFGYRRLQAALSLGWSEIGAIRLSGLADAARALVAERDENTCRKDFTPSEAVALGRAIEELEKAKAKERRLEGNSRGGRAAREVEDNLPSTSSRKQNPQTRDIVGEAVGMSGAIYQRAKAVVAAAEEDPERFGEIAAEMDRTGKVTPAYDKVTEIKKGESPTVKTSPRSPTAEAGTPSAKRTEANPNRRSVAVALATEAVNCLRRIPIDDPNREQGFQIVESFVKHNR